MDVAEADFDSLREARLRDITAALATKSESGRIHIHQETHAGKVRALSGAVSGVILGAIVPPAGVALVANSLVGGAALGGISHFTGGLSRSDLKQLGSMLDDGDAAVVAVGVDAVAEDVDRSLGRAVKRASKDVDKGDVSAAIADLQKGATGTVEHAADDLS